MSDEFLELLVTKYVIHKVETAADVLAPLVMAGCCRHGDGILVVIVEHSDGLLHTRLFQQAPHVDDFRAHSCGLHILGFC